MLGDCFTIEAEGGGEGEAGEGAGVPESEGGGVGAGSGGGTSSLHSPWNSGCSSRLAVGEAPWSGSGMPLLLDLVMGKV